ncbi:MAG TPA: sigma 54-interacting transcriptional regulator [Thermoanaerobaculia bacterium]|jgi:DNA-binding NtrC family response regulator|nr:sigma 54-interacting transcriptional regulator [Thermoanaerobaculia bacterium]
MTQTALPSTLYEVLQIERNRAPGNFPGGRAELLALPSRGEGMRREPSGLGGLLGRTPAMLELFRRLEKASHSHSPVLIEGETGAGKRLTACTLHAMGPGAAGPFVAIAAASLEGRQGNVLATLLSQGHERGGTLFIDEVSDLPAEAQRELWRLLETARRRPMGLLPRTAMRIVCSTSRDLRAEVERGSLRDDLHARLRGFVLPVPSLRERRDDLLLLIEHFLAELSQVHGKRTTGLAPAALDLLLAHSWEGNVRELRGELERAVILTPEGAAIEPRALSPDLLPSGTPRAGQVTASLKQRSRALEKKMLADALARHRWNVAATARELGISRVGLSKKLRSLELKRPPRAPHPSRPSPVSRG